MKNKKEIDKISLLERSKEYLKFHDSRIEEYNNSIREKVWEKENLKEKLENFANVEEYINKINNDYLEIGIEELIYYFTNIKPITKYIYCDPRAMRKRIYYVVFNEEQLKLLKEKNIISNNDKKYARNVYEHVFVDKVNSGMPKHEIHTLIYSNDSKKMEKVFKKDEISRIKEQEKFKGMKF